VPKPVNRISFWSALPFPLVSLTWIRSRPLPIYTPPCPRANPVGMFSPSAKVEILSALPSPSVSSRMISLSSGFVPGFNCGYAQVHNTQRRPSGSQRKQIGLEMPMVSSAKRLIWRRESIEKDANSASGELFFSGGETERGFCPQVKMSVARSVTKNNTNRVIVTNR